MSTYWNYECIDHDPPLQSEEFTQHTDDTSFARGVELAMSRPIDPDYVNSEGYIGGYFESNAHSFLRSHPKCRLELVSEYGERRELKA